MVTALTMIWNNQPKASAGIRLRSEAIGFAYGFAPALTSFLYFQERLQEASVINVESQEL